MSFILDALRKAEHTKSEHESLRVPSPTIVNDEIPSRPRTPAANGMLWILPGMALLAIGIWALLPKSSVQTSEVVVSQDSSQLVSTSDPRAGVNTATLPGNTNTPIAQETVTTVIRRDTGARALDQVARRGQPPAPVGATSQVRNGGSVSTINERSSNTSNPSGGFVPGTVTILPASDDLPTEQSSPPLSQPNSISTTTNRPGGSVSSEVLPEYRSVLVGGKVPLPKISLDMHVYSSTPSKRFVFINLNKLGEGEQLDGETSIEEILPDGAVLNHKGFRFIVRPD